MNPYQARVSTMEKVVKQLTTLVSTWPDWPFALVQLNGDACHTPLPREGHLSILAEGGTSSAACRRVSQLEVCQLLSSGSQVIYPVGLNGCEVPVIVTGQSSNLCGGEPIYLKVDIPQSIMEGPKLKVLPPGGHSSSTLMASPIRAALLKGEREVRMIVEVRELLSQVGLDMSGHVSRNSTPKRLDLVVLVTLLPTKPGDFPRPVDTSSQVSTLDDAEMEDASLEEIPTASSPIAETPGPSGGIPPADEAISGKRPTRLGGNC